MDAQVQRAILLKAIMEALGKSQAVGQADFYKDIEEERFKGRWCRYNASSELLAAGLPEYVKSVEAVIEEHPSLLPADPLWSSILAFALRGKVDDGPNILPRSLAALQHWRARDAHAPEGERHYVTRDMGGCWYIFRLTSKGDEDRSVTVSLLNIRPEFYYESAPSRSIEFSLTARADDKRDPLVKVHGICRHHGLQLHFLGLLTKRSAPLPTAMVLHYDDDDGRQGHRERTEGVLFTSNSKREQIAAPVVASYIEGSDTWRGDEYDARKSELVEKLGHFKAGDLKTMPDGVYTRLLERSKSEWVYESQ